ncbi:S9 family peptidase [Aquitalea palustris]|uniref:S9 family peptidase n=1 Tax=Aquitalea palustris TaxID=2480983 RepID=A0A454JN79_9NEIS|nr:prolyl oligopeptidase family serine peptidase [Aquitalea palustris]RMD01764.1 S9 family peptidase [Aquitalea palustris]
MSHLPDSHLWLESLDDPAVLQWVAAQNSRTQALLDTDARYAPLQRDILAHLRDTRQIPFFSEHAGWLYNFHQDEHHPRGIYRRSTLAAYQSGAQEWQTVLDVDALAAEAGKDWFLDGVAHCTVAPTRVLVHLSEGGGDASLAWEYDLDAAAWVEQGLRFPKGKNHIAWRDPDSVFVCPGWKGAPLTRSGYPSEVWLVERAADGQHQWQQLFVAPKGAMMVAAWRYLDGTDGVLDLIEAADGFYSKTYHLIDAELQTRPLPLPAKADIEGYLHGQFIVKLAEDWSWQGVVHLAGSLLAVPLKHLLGGEGVVQCLVQPAPRLAIESVETTRSSVVVNLIDNVRSRLQAFDLHGAQWQPRSLPVPDSGVIEFADQPWDSEVLCYSFSDFLNPTGLYRLDVASGQQECLRQQPAAFDASRFVAEQCWATAPDGVAIPYFVVRARDVVLDGSTPTLLYGYGGFEVPMMPYYVENFGAHWLEQGGAFVLACIRGGGEFGPGWHQAAQGVKRPVSFDDFCAVAEALIASGLTSPARLGIEGGSNGGLLVAACMVRRPELFKAVVCEVPLLDMLRYTELLAGASWIDEYGDPANPEEAAALAAYSPYHQIKPEAAYPLALFTTSARDDRVHPGHARKMVARLQELGHAALLIETDAGGHTGNAGQQQTAEELARVLVYLYQRLMD